MNPRNACSMALAILLVAGCRNPTQGPGAGQPRPGDEEGFSTVDWEDLTGELLDASRAQDVKGFQDKLSPSTVESFETIWKEVRAKTELCIDDPACDQKDRQRLEHLHGMCSWDTFVKSYKPGRLVTINLLDDGRYDVTEVTPVGRKMTYVVEPDGQGGWRIHFEKDNRWLNRLEKGLHAGVDRILEKNGLLDDGAAGAPPAEASPAPETQAGP